MRLALALAAGLVPVALASSAVGHGGVDHATPAEAAAHASAEAPATGPALPFPVEIRPHFRLIDQAGQAVTEADFAGRPMAIFFGYANCEAICSVALPALAAALDELGPDGDAIAPLMITVDPEHDTPEAMARKLPDGSPIYSHGSFIYLVGRDGLVKSVLPPILSAERIAELMRKHL